MNNTADLKLSQEEAAGIREALLIGLAAYGEFLEKENACKLAEACGSPWPKEARPIDPCSSADTVTKFATALAFVDIAERSARGFS